MENVEIKLSTMYICNEITKCTSIKKMKEQIFPLLKDQKEQWAIKINKIISDNSYTKTDFAKLCGVSRVSVDKWCKGSIPKSRETFIKIGLAAHYDSEGINRLLQRYGKYSGLYSKNLKDCVCLYVLQNYTGDEQLLKYVEILEKIEKRISNNSAENAENITTEKFDAKLSAVQNKEALEQFLDDNIAMFSFKYHKLYAYVKVCLATKLSDQNENVYGCALAEEWSSSLRQCVSGIRQNTWIPNRNKIISLGLHLSMGQEQVNKMLTLAHMEPLCANNIFESVIIFILNTFEKGNGLEMNWEDENQLDLYQYAERVMRKLDFQEFVEFISELSEKSYE